MYDKGIKNIQFADWNNTFMPKNDEKENFRSLLIICTRH
jgi:hypothetical protein